MPSTLLKLSRRPVSKTRSDEPQKTTVKTAAVTKASFLTIAAVSTLAIAVAWPASTGSAGEMSRGETVRVAALDASGSRLARRAASRADRDMMRGARVTLEGRFELTTTHRSYAPIALGELTVPDGAFDLPWATSPTLTPVETGDEASEETAGRTVTAPSLRQEPSTKHRLMTARAKEQRMGGENGAGWSFIPAAFIPGNWKRGDAGEGRSGAVMRWRPAEIAFTENAMALSSAACRVLDRMAEGLSGAPNPVLIETHAHVNETLGATREAAQARAEAVRTYLLARGVAPERVRISVTQHEGEIAAPQRVDVHTASS